MLDSSEHSITLAGWTGNNQKLSIGVGAIADPVRPVGSNFQALSGAELKLASGELDAEFSP